MEINFVAVFYDARNALRMKRAQRKRDGPEKLINQRLWQCNRNEQNLISIQCFKYLHNLLRSVVDPRDIDGFVWKL